MNTPRPRPISVTSDLGVDKGVVADFVRDLRDAGEEAAAPKEPGWGGGGVTVVMLSQGVHLEAMAAIFG